MRKEEFAEILGEINERYIKEASVEKNEKAKKPIRLKWGMVAACLCLVIGLVIPVLNGDHADQGYHGGLDRVNTPIYHVVEYTAPASYDPADLYVFTTADLAEYDAHMAKNFGDKYLGAGVRVFSFVEGATAQNFNVWYFDYDGASISHIYYVTKSGDKLLTAWCEAGELSRAIEALASETSADTPMYLVQDDEIIYAVIGKTAYYLPGTVMKPKVSQMPEIDTEGLDTVVIDVTG